ncbi:alpha/beta fold hydrolase [Alsobacter sp. SYSU M60028]|uniref:Alpha/beta fold hydrolase n=1 Tax=Alsobacter ponti TaxID=2962936 RepID=A0ABT1L836_9HYPH|nr:alpha/beta fold hydrolase [Alsobacter ponti]
MSEATLAPFTRGVSPAALMLASFDWLLHLAVAPGKRMELVDKAARKNARFLSHVAATALGQDAPPCIEPLPGDHRFRAQAWGSPPWSLWSQGFLLTQQWWHNVTREVPGVSPHHEEVVSFVARQLLDIVSPSNNPALNPEVLERTRDSGGANFLTGFSNWLEDASRLATGRPPVGSDAFVPGREVAVTPGKVVFRNHLIELLQYAPTTETVRAEPVLIVPAWIMKYYILDLSPHNSLIRYLVEHGHTVFCVSWRNPGAEDRDLTLDDYRRLGVMAALDAIDAIVPDRKVHAAGYCLGGTLLAATAAAMATRGDDRLASLTLLAAQTDFTEPGELALFIDHSELHFLDSMMWNRGYLSTDQMAGAFQLLRSNDLVWSRLVREYLMGERAAMTDLMAWNADATRMPYKMHSEYLRRLYIDNELASGRFMVEGRPAVIQNIRAPMFVVGTEADHVAPWRSVFKIHYLADTDVTFALASGGHNAGIVSEPGHRNRHYRLATKHANEMCVSPEEWAAALEPTAGSWWTAWERWLTRHSSETRVKPPGFGGAGARRRMDDAPGTYVLQR